MSHQPFHQQSINAVDQSQEAAFSLCQLSRSIVAQIQMSSWRNLPEMLNFIPLFDNLLKLVTEMQNEILHFQNMFSTGQNVLRKRGKDLIHLHEFHRKLKNKMDVLSCVTKMQRRIEESFVWPLMEHVSRKPSENCSEGSSHKSKLSKLNLHLLHKNADTILRQLHLNLRQLKSVKQSSQFQHIIHDVVSLLRDHCTQLLDSFNNLANNEKLALPLLLINLGHQQVCNLNNNIFSEKNVKEITNKIYIAVCTSASQDIEETVKLIKDVVRCTYMEKLLDKGKWSSLFKFGPEFDQPSYKISQSVQEVQSSTNRQGFNPLKRKLLVDCSPEGRKTALITSSRLNDGRLNQLTKRPSKYYKRLGDSEFASLVWDSDNGQYLRPNKTSSSVPSFRTSELRPTFHKSSKLGCSHYARSCKLRHPSNGRLYTCRMCCEIGINSLDECRSPPLDRFAVTEVLCMKCNTLQPSGLKCINPECVSKGTPFARYACTECNLFDDDEKKDIYHCPHCNVCRIGKGLGIDYKHCMECDACVAIEDFENHTCVSRRLKCNCPLCGTGPALSHSTEPIQSMSCGHSFHTSCFNLFSHLRHSNIMRCPICRKEDEVK